MKTILKISRLRSTDQNIESVHCWKSVKIESVALFLRRRATQLINWLRSSSFSDFWAGFGAYWESFGATLEEFRLKNTLSFLKSASKKKWYIDRILGENAAHLAVLLALYLILLFFMHKTWENKILSPKVGGRLYRLGAQYKSWVRRGAPKSWPRMSPNSKGIEILNSKPMPATPSLSFRKTSVFQFKKNFCKLRAAPSKEAKLPA